MKNKTIITTIILLLIVPLINADCFFYPESLNYCQEINLGDALTECSFYESCQIESFFKQQSCLELEQCQKVFCKSSCSYEFKGKCLAGEIQKGEESQWCSAGCCVFNYHDLSYCNYQNNRYSCEIEANNKGANGYVYEKQLNQPQCLTVCQNNLMIQEIINQNPLNQIVQNVQFFPSPLQNNYAEETKSEKSNFIYFIFGLVLIIIALIYLRIIFSKPKQPKLKLKPVKQKKESNLSRLFFPFSRKKKKVVEKRKEVDFLKEFGPLPIRVEDDFTKLKKLVRNYQKDKLNGVVKKKKTSAHRKSGLKEDIFTKLKKIVQK